MEVVGSKAIVLPGHEVIWVDFDGGRRCRSVASKCGTWTWRVCLFAAAWPAVLIGG